MPTNGWRSPSNDSAALHVENVDRMPHDVTVSVVDAAGQRVFDAEFAVWHGDDAVHHDVFTTEGPYDVTVSVRYGPTEQLRHDGGTLYLAITEEPGNEESGNEESGNEEPGNEGAADAPLQGGSEEAGRSAMERNV